MKSRIGRSMTERWRSLIFAGLLVGAGSPVFADEIVVPFWLPPGVLYGPEIVQAQFGQVLANNPRLKGADTGSPVSLVAEGIDANISVTITPKGTGVITLNGPVVFGAGASGAIPANSFLYGGASGTLAATAAALNGQVLIGSTGAVPVAATLTAGQNILVTNGAGSIAVAVTPNPVFSTVSTASGAFAGIPGDHIWAKTTFPAIGPGFGAGALRWRSGTIPGTCRLVAAAGTGNSESTVLDNIGNGC